MVDESLGPTRWTYLLQGSSLGPCSGPSAARFQGALRHTLGVPQSSAPCSSPDHSVTHPESRLARPAHPFHISSPTPAPPPGQVQLASPLPSHPHPHPTHSPAVVGFHPDLVRMVPAAAAACDRVRHGTAVSLGRHLLPPPPQRWRPTGAAGAVGDSEARVSPGAAAARSPTCPPRPRRGPRGRLAGAAGTRTAPPTASGRHCLCCSRGPARLPPPPLPPHTLQRPTFRGRAGATIDPTQDARLNHSYGGKEKGREEGGMLNITKNLPAGGLSWAVTERM